MPLGNVLGPVKAFHARAGDDDDNIPKVRLDRVERLRGLWHLEHVCLHDDRFVPQLFNVRDHLLSRRLSHALVTMTDALRSFSSVIMPGLRCICSRDQSNFAAHVGGRGGCVSLEVSFKPSAEVS